MNSKEIKINPYDDKWQKIELTDSLIDAYSLANWAKNFSLMTAGYRDQLDPKDANNPEVAFNSLTIAIMGEAKARVFKQKLAGNTQAHVHIGGETRPHTQEFISILSRIYSAHNIKVHLRERVKTTPIWYSSFGVFYNGFESGENLTASHSPFFKGGWKPMDSMGKQLLAEEKEIIAEVQNIIKNKDTITLAPWSPNENILNDFEIDEPYVEYQKSIILEKSQDDIKQAIKKGFRFSICTSGGSMKATTERLFNLFGITDGKQYFYDEEDSEYHQIGKKDGPDPSKPQVYKNIGAQEIIHSNKANIVLIWDPDGDRLNIVTSASADKAKYYSELGLEVEILHNSDKCIVYFTPNQIYLMLTSYRIDVLKATNLLNTYDWFVTISISTSRSIEEIALANNIPVTHVRVGFKYMGTFAEWIEARSDTAEYYTSPTGEKIILGKNPRALIMCEESGGAVFGGKDLLENKSGTKGLISLREKDGMQLGLLTLSLAAFLHNNNNQSFADYYCSLIKKYNIKYKYFNRCDVRLYDESLTGNDLQKAKSAGIQKRDKTMEYFMSLAKRANTGESLENICNEINAIILKCDKFLPAIKLINLAGEGILDGILLEFQTFWCLIRASGTDALLRYYLEGQNKEEIEVYQKILISLKI
ncbi:hypothetical protein HY745_05810 [Candidatus Desantisbacteria bacterium]|nr:hypothetical protein [Candidatus Desantisbacteria bacterium]